MTIKTLILDLETFPTEGWVWGLWDQRLSLAQVKKPGCIASWAAKFTDSDMVEYSSVHMTSPKNMLKEMWKLLDEADEVVGWNSNSFDLKLLNAAFAINGLGPPSPYKKIDLMREVKKNMKFLSNKLDFISGQFGVGHKLKHQGFDLWVQCMKGDDKAWELFEEYNIQDVLLTERMYQKLRPWITTGVNRSAVTGTHSCPNCGNTKLQARGTALTTTMTYQRYQCVGVDGCGQWSRTRIANKQDRSKQLVGVR